MSLSHKSVHRSADDFQLSGAVVRSEAFWGISRLSETELEPIRAVLKKYIQVCSDFENSWLKINQSISQDLQSVLNRQGRLKNAYANFLSSDTDLNFGFSLTLDVKTPDIRIVPDSPINDHICVRECAAQILKILKSNRRYRPIAIMLETKTGILEQAINLDFERNKQQLALEPDFKRATKNYYWADASWPLELGSLIDDFDKSFRFIKDSLFVRQPQQNSRYSLLLELYNNAIDSRYNQTVSLLNVPGVGSVGTEEVVIDILKTTRLLSGSDSIPFQPYSRERADFLVEQAAALLDNLNGLPLYLSAPIRSVFAAYVFGGLAYSGFKYSINDISDREFKGLLQNQIISPRPVLVRLAEGDDPVLAADAFNALVKQQESILKLFNLL